jgi:hypothetical protein
LRVWASPATARLARANLLRDKTGPDGLVEAAARRPFA